MRRVLSLLMGLQTCFQMTVGKKKRYFPCHKSQTWAVRSQEVTELCAFHSLCTKSTDIIDVLSRRMMRMAPRTAPSVDWFIILFVTEISQQLLVDCHDILDRCEAH